MGVVVNEVSGGLVERDLEEVEDPTGLGNGVARHVLVPNHQVSGKKETIVITIYQALYPGFLKS